MRAFYYHEITGQVLLQFIRANGDNHALLTHQILKVLVNDERRATLLLSYLFLRSQITTRCCEFPVCLNCNCRVVVLKVEGSDLTVCLCGFRMKWPKEFHYRKLEQKNVLPVNLFDLDAM
uniref:Uncharacterized protein n=1 Tax=Globisporangium ultimum (strain ATCC 200006 / CBS 805.95 / DAOM BR144) TaxID=431595 RepID=K3X2T8_GLOUD